jgi:hypothetical protein
MQHTISNRIAALTKAIGGTAKLVDTGLGSNEELQELGRANRSVRAMIAQARQVLRELKTAPIDQPLDPLDPDDAISGTLLEVQELIRDIIAHMDEFLAHYPQQERLKPDHDRLRKGLVLLHKLIGELRMSILEHDADCSPVVGPFDNVKDLINSLRHD